MTQDEIIEMAESCGWDKGNTWDDCMRCSPFNIETFAKLVAQHERERIKQANAPEIERINNHIKELEDAVLAEREACAEVCKKHADVYAKLEGNPTAKSAWAACIDNRDAIRARGQA
jgi:hypothetical protein